MTLQFNFTIITEQLKDVTKHVYHSIFLRYVYEMIIFLTTSSEENWENWISVKYYGSMTFGMGNWNL